MFAAPRAAQAEEADGTAVAGLRCSEMSGPALVWGGELRPSELCRAQSPHASRLWGKTKQNEPILVHAMLFLYHKGTQESFLQDISKIQKDKMF